MQLSPKQFSDGLGAASIICWLFAQFPQLIANWRSASVEGLALPFLLSWLLGDITNLAGCILTFQLPFQTYLAAYFVFIDLALTLQYLYYSRQKTEHAKLTRSHTRHQQRAAILPHQYDHHAISPSISASTIMPPRSQSHSRPSTWRTSQKRHSTDSHLPSTLAEANMTASYMTDTSRSKRRRREHFHRSASSRSRRTEASAIADTIPPLDAMPEDEAVEHFPSPRLSADYSNRSADSVPTNMVDSVQSVLSHASTASAQSSSTLPRGRRKEAHLTRSAPLPPLPGTPQLRESAGPEMRQSAFSRDRGPSRSRHSTSRARNAVFLSIWVFFSFNHLSSYRSSSITSPSLSTPTSQQALAWSAWTPSGQYSHTAPIDASATLYKRTVDLQSSPLPDIPQTPTVNIRRLIGRLSAWICVVFYLTSRMPQIWKNFRRRSVEGLSMLLFIAAFHGNLFYVGSILTSPLVQEEEGYILESIPFLIGSGGTLVFDLIILFQSWLYSGRKGFTGRHSRILHAASGVRDLGDEEEAAALLSNDVDLHNVEDDSTPTGGHSRNRSRSLSSRRAGSTTRLWKGGQVLSHSTELQRSPSRTRFILSAEAGTVNPNGVESNNDYQR
ncbi:hypothetical protein EMMF5_004421 [Cystobasidiomycetes sp. EMM_F5]